MCNFFSFITTEKGDYLYLDYEQRKELNFNRVDSHSKIAEHYYKENKGQKVNAYEFSPLTKELVQDAKNFEEDLAKVKDWCLNLDFKKIVPELIIKPIVNPFEIDCKEVTQQDIDNLKQWASVWFSVRDSVGDSVGASVGASVRDSVGASVRDSVWDSVRDSVGTRVRDSIWAYISSFFNLDGKWKDFEDLKGNPFQCCIDLWHRGLVPSFDGKVWRLHSKNGIVYATKESEVLK